MAVYNIRPLPPLSARDIDRFYSKIDKTPGHGPHGDCWVWKAARTVKGDYGVIRIGGRSGMLVRAPRIAHFLYTGEDSELPMRHSCDNPPCCNPAHISKGTPKENTKDMISRERDAFAVVRKNIRNGPGEQCMSSKLTTSQVM